MHVAMNQSPSDARELRLTIRFDPRGLRLERSLIGVIVHLADANMGPPGAPALPVRLARIALPRGMRAAGLAVETRETAALTDGPVAIAPVQPPRPGVGADEAYRWKGWRRCGAPGEGLQSPREPLPTPAYTAPDLELFAAAERQPAARLIGTDTSGPTPIATIALHPVRVADGGCLEFSAAIDVTVALEPGGGGDEPEGPPSNIVSRAQAMRAITLERLSVINPEWVLDYSRYFPIDLISPADYLIVTDNNSWDPATQSPIGPAGGDLVASFQKLVDWKRQRGLRARVVTLTDIVGERWGDFRTGSRDLQETLRNFLKMAHSDWGVAWVLIGGDVGIVPIRHAGSGCLGGIDRQDANPPPENKSVWTGHHLRIHAVNLGDWWEASIDNMLVRRNDGRLIPYDPAGTSSSTVPGWYFTTSDSYATRSAVATQFVRANGPASLVDADLQFLYTWNVIPTDLYYSSLEGPCYDQPGKHDWDLVDNGVYGQVDWNNDLDGVNYTPTLSLGRAPVNNAADADAFVAKVIAYEKYQRPDGTPLESDWPWRAVIASANWGGRLWIFGTASSPPEANHYHHDAGADHSIIRLETVPDWQWSLLAYLSEEDVRLIPYGAAAASAGHGWYFARGPTDLTPNTLDIPFGAGVVHLPLPSQWIVVHAPAEELSPSAYVFNRTEIDGSLADQEELRAQLRADMHMPAPRRLYEDFQDMSPAQLAAGPVEMLTTAGLRAALDAGPHIVSLSGHGSSDGCCSLNVAMAQTLANGFHTFIGYADSCLTAQSEAIAMGEALLTNPNGGAVAYVGSTRFSWIGCGDDYQRLFFKEWARLRDGAHLGLLADTRASRYDTFGAYSRWIVLSLNLLGCPEMPLWGYSPYILRVPDLYIDYIDRRLRLRLEEIPPCNPLFPDVPYREDWDVTRVHIRQGEHEQFLAVRGDTVDAALTGFSRGPATVTIARAGHSPLVREVDIGRRRAGGALAGLVLLVLFVVVVALLLFRR